MMVEIDFWYSTGSTYTYLSASRLGDVARRSGIRFRWRPFNVRQIMVAQNNIPFRDKPVKTAYMWRDIKRRAAAYGLSPVIPAPYSLPELVFANQVVVIGAEEGWAEAYACATYRRWFEAGQRPGEEPNLSESLAEIGEDPTRVTARARSEAAAATLAAATDEAMALGIVGSPNFVVGREIFWGDDRLDDAIAFARAGGRASGTPVRDSANQAGAAR